MRKYILNERDDNSVTFVRLAGAQYVKNTMPIESAQKLLRKGRVKKSGLPGYPICVDDEWYFEGSVVDEREKKVEEEAE